jgi:hypothetical protein
VGRIGWWTFPLPVRTAVAVGRAVSVLCVRVGLVRRRLIGCGSEQLLGGLGTQSKLFNFGS